MVDWGTIITAVVSIVVCILTGVFGYKTSKIQVQLNADKIEAEHIAEQRKKENILAMRLTHANTKLTIGVATALKVGHANGEIEEGLKAVKEANEEYERFLQEVASDHLQ